MAQGNFGAPVIKGPWTSGMDQSLKLAALTAPGWPWAGLAHGFLGRHGGVSDPPYSSLNFSASNGDDPDDVKENWRIFKRAAGVHGTTVVTMSQVHGDRVLVADKSSGKNAGEGDAIVTATPGVLLGILTADCVPVLIVDPERRIAAAVHAGWKGTLSGILPKTIGLTRERFGTRPLDLYFAVGPSIGPCCYEVSSEIYDRFETQWGQECARAWRPGVKGKGFLDLREINIQMLEREGVPQDRIARVGPCTACSTRDFFSHRGEAGKTGRQLSYVGWL